jgi:glycosyltransferase involved in cell wall biosynthesis
VVRTVSKVRASALAAPLSVAIITKNEERAIADCLKSVRFLTDVHVVDSGSTDQTVEIATEHGAQVHQFVWDGAYPKKKQWTLDSLPFRHPWVLLLDADERVTPQLASELGELVTSERRNSLGAVDIPLHYHWQGTPLNHGHTVVKRSLVHRGRASFPIVDDLSVSTMWEVEGHYQPQTEYSITRATSRLCHYDPDPLRTWLDRHNRYSDWEAYLRESGLHSHVAGLRSGAGARFSQMPAKPLVFFIYSYVVKRGFLDGHAGLDYALAQAFYYWQIDAKVREMRHHRHG